MDLRDTCEIRVENILDKVASRDKVYVDSVFDLVLWANYGQDVLSQFGYSVYSWGFRHKNGMTRLSIKAVESGVPLVAFVSSASPTGCIEQLFTLLEKGGVRWQKDKYPSI